MRHSRICFSRLYASLQVVLLILLVAAGQAAGAERIHMTYSSISGSQAILRVTADAGIFAKNGLDVVPTFIASGPRGVQALLGGDVPFAILGGPAPLRANLAGADTVIIIGLLNTLDHSLIVSAKIQSPQDLKGKKFAVSNIGSLDDSGLRIALRKWGYDPVKDVTILQVGGQPDRFAALRAGAVDATMIQAPLTVTARKAGYRTLVALADLDIPYQGTMVATTRSFIAKSPDTVRRLTRSFVEGIHFAKTHKEGTLKSISAFMKLKDPEALEETYQTYAIKLGQQAPYPTVDGIKLMLEQIAAEKPEAKPMDPTRFADLRFIRELDNEGFIKQLYGR